MPNYFETRAITDEFTLDMLICACFEFPAYFNEPKLKKIIMEYFKMEADWLIELTHEELVTSIKEIVEKYKES